MSKKKPVSDLAKSIANLGLNFAENQVEKKITDPVVQEGIKLVFPVTKELLEVLNDDNEANAAQVKEVVLGFVNNEVADFLESILKKRLEGIQDEHQKKVIGFVFDVVIDLLRTYTDDVADNKTQVHDILEDFKQNGQMEEVVKAMVMGIIIAKANVSADAKQFAEKAIDVVLSFVK